MNIWMDGQVVEQMDGKMNAWIIQYLDGLMNREADKWMETWTDVWGDIVVDGWMMDFYNNEVYL